MLWMQKQVDLNISDIKTKNMKATLQGVGYPVICCLLFAVLPILTLPFRNL